MAVREPYCCWFWFCVGRGAFCTFESEIIDAKGETVTRYQLGLIPNLSYRVEF